MSHDSNVARRTFLMQCTSVGAFGLTGAPQSAFAASSSDLEMDAYQNQLGSPFYVQTAAGDTVEVELKEVVPSRYPPGPVGRRQPFSMIFRVPGNTRLSQDVYTVKHSRLGSASYLLVPVDSPRTCNHLEAVMA